MPQFLDLRTAVDAGTDTSNPLTPAAATPVVIGDIGLVTLEATTPTVRVELSGYANVTAATVGDTVTFQIYRGTLAAGTLIFTTIFTAAPAGDNEIAGFTAADTIAAPAAGLLQYQLVVTTSAADTVLGARTFVGVAAAG